MKALFCFIVLAVPCFQLFAQQESLETLFPKDVDKLIQSYQFAKALPLLEGRADSLSLDVLQRKGTCYYHMGNYGDAIREYEKLVSIDSSHQGALLALAQLYGRQKQYKESFGYYNRLLAVDSLNAYYYKQYGIAALQAKAPAEAVHNFLVALKLNPRDIESYGLLADLLIEGKQARFADSLLTIALSISPSPHLRYLQANAKLSLNKYEEVIKITNELIAESSTTSAYARLLGISYFKLGEYEEAIHWMNFLLKSDLKAEWVYYYLGVSYEHLNKPDSAIVYINKAIEEGISGAIGNYYLHLATSYEAVNKFKMAIKYYKAAYEETKSGMILYHIARNYDVFYKDRAQAIKYFKRYLESKDTVRLTREYARMRVNELEFYR